MASLERLPVASSRPSGATSGQDIRVGIHTGEIEKRDYDDVRGMAVHIAARVIGRARDEGVAVSSTVQDLVTGSGFSFYSTGTHQLRGNPRAMGHLRSSGGDRTRPPITGARSRPNDAGEVSCDGELEGKRQSGYLFDAAPPCVI